MGLEYSTDGLYNRSILTLKRLIIYVEDYKKESEYEIILEKLFDERIRDDAFICPCGGKQYVIDAYNKNIDNKNNKVYLYIVDGDFDIILNKIKIIDETFLYLDRYNIENYLVDEDSVINFFRSEKAVIYSEAKKWIDFNNWFSKTCDGLSKLFYYYLYINWLDIDEKPITIKEPENKFFDNNTGEINSDKINEKIFELIDYVKKKGVDHDSKFKYFDSKYNNDFYSNSCYYICGKYLLFGLRLYLNHIAKKHNLSESIRSQNLKRYLIEHINCVLFTFLIKRFRRYIETSLI